jgi:uncharacterized protein
MEVPMSDRVERARSLYEAFARGDVPTVLAAFAPDIEWSEAENVTFWTGAPFRGVEAVVQNVFMKLPETFGDSFSIAIDRLHGAGDTVIMEGRYTGTALATGRDLSAQVVHVWEYEGDQIKRFQQYTDTWQWAEVTGVSPAAAV